MLFKLPCPPSCPTDSAAAIAHAGSGCSDCRLSGTCAYPRRIFVPHTYLGAVLAGWAISPGPGSYNPRVVRRGPGAASLKFRHAGAKARPLKPKPKAPQEQMPGAGLPGMFTASLWQPCLHGHGLSEWQAWLVLPPALSRDVRLMSRSGMMLRTALGRWTMRCHRACGGRRPTAWRAG